MRKVNKSWSFKIKQYHIELMWRDHVVLIDSQDFHFFENNQLRILKGNNSKHYYVNIVKEVSRKFSYVGLHREILKAGAKDFIDHKNTNSLDNRRSNLRLCTNSQNHMNAWKRTQKENKPRMTSKYKGVHKRNGSWICQIGKASSRERYVFKNEIDAALKYNERALVLFGDFARLNVIKR